MPRQANGQYILPTGNPVVPDTLITSAWANPTMSDIGNALSDSLSRSGLGGMNAPLGIVSGSVSQPAIAFLTEAGTGIYRAGFGSFDVGVLGIGILSVNQQGLRTIAGSAGQPSIRMESAPTGFYSGGSGIISAAIGGVSVVDITQGYFRFGGPAGAASHYIYLDGPTGFERAIVIRSGTSSRWSFGLYANDNYALSAYSDSSSVIDEPMSVIRAAGGAIVLGGASAARRPVEFTGWTTYISQAAPPAAPAAGEVSLYVTGGALFAKDSAGAVTPIAPSGLTDLIGMIAWRHSAGGKWLRLDGQTVSKVTYAALWAYAQGFLTVDQAVSPGLYLDVDASNFKVPILSGLFLRGQGTSPGTGYISAALGALQADALQTHVHFSSRPGIVGAGGNAQEPGTTQTATGAPQPPARLADETRPANIALIPCVFAG